MLGQIDNQHKDKSYFSKLPSATENLDEDNINMFFKAMFERQEVWYKRNILKQAAPWTKDKILANYKFTNVYRELDRASQWLIKNVLTDTANQTMEDIIFKIIIFRFYNKPDTFTHPKYKVELQSWHTFNVERMWEESVLYREKVDNPWHTAYMFNMAFLPMPKDWKGRGLFKDEAYIKFIFPKVHAIIPELKKRIRSSKDVESVLKYISDNIPAVSTFLTHEYFLDFTYVTRYWRQPLWNFTENDYTNVGPGASLGIRLLFPSLQTIKDQKEAMYWLRDIAEAELEKYGKFKYISWNKSKKEYEITNKCNITLHQIEMFLCEFQKYWKMLIGEGKQRSKFTPDSNHWKL